MTFHLRARIGKAFVQPGFLRSAKHGAASLQPLRAIGDYGAAAAAGLRTGCMRAVLAIVEHEEGREVAECIAVVQQRIRTARQRARRERHVLVVGLIGGGAAHEKGRVEVLPLVVGIVVVDFVIVPRHEPRRRRVHALQVGVLFIQRVAITVLVQRARFAGVVLAHMVAAPRGLVDVIAEKNHEIEVLARHVAIGAEIALFVLLAGRERETQALAGGAGRGGSARAADRAWSRHRPP